MEEKLKMAVFDDLIYTLDYYSVSDVLLPFLLIFMLVYAILQKSKILGDDSKNFNVTLAVIMGLGVVFPHVLGLYGEPSVVDIINRALPSVSLFIVIIVMFLLLMGIFAKDIEFGGASITGWMVWISLIAIFVIFGSSAGWFGLPNFLYFLNDPQLQSLVVIVLVFALIIGFVTSDPNKSKRKELGKFKIADFIKK